MRPWLALACLCAALAGRAAAAEPLPPRPKLIVVIAVDQFSLELFERYRPTFTGGLKRLGEGLAFTGYQSHAATETCPGHSTILTGDHPARTGMVANSWYDRTSGSTVYCVSVHGSADPLARGPDRLRVDTLGDWLKRQRPGSRSIAVSGKDRAAITLGGHHADAVYWWTDGQGFSTSAHAGPATAAVLAPAQAFDRALFAGWRRRPPPLWPAEVPERCRALERPYRIGRLQLAGRIPPDSAGRAEQGPGYLAASGFSDELRASPSFDPLTLSFASRLVETFHLGRGPQTDLLAVSLSSTDSIGHRYGNGGAETCVQLAELDAALGRFLDGLDRLGTPYVVALTADHGAIDTPERLGPPAQRIDAARLAAALNGRLRQAFGLTYDPLAGEDPNQLVVNLAPLDNQRRAAVVAEAVAWLKDRPEVAAVFTADEVARAAPPPGKRAQDLTLAERFHESFDPERSGDIMVAYAQGATLGEPAAAGSAVAGHGSPWDYDRRVPILFWWPGAPSTPEPRPIETVDIAPTLAAMAGVTAPPIDGRCIELGQGCPAPAPDGR